MNKKTLWEFHLKWSLLNTILKLDIDLENTWLLFTSVLKNKIFISPLLSILSQLKSVFLHLFCYIWFIWYEGTKFLTCYWTTRTHSLRKQHSLCYRSWDFGLKDSKGLIIFHAKFTVRVLAIIDIEFILKLKGLWTW